MTAEERQRWLLARARCGDVAQLVTIRYASGTPDARHREVPTVNVPAECIDPRYAPPVDAQFVPLSDRMPGERFAIAPSTAIRWRQGHAVGLVPEVLPEGTWPVAEISTAQGGAAR